MLPFNYKILRAVHWRLTLTQWVVVLMCIPLNITFLHCQAEILIEERKKERYLHMNLSCAQLCTVKWSLGVIWPTVLLFQFPFVFLQLFKKKWKYDSASKKMNWRRKAKICSVLYTAQLNSVQFIRWSLATLQNDKYTLKKNSV